MKIRMVLVEPDHLEYLCFCWQDLIMHIVKSSMHEHAQILQLLSRRIVWHTDCLSAGMLFIKAIVFHSRRTRQLSTIGLHELLS